MPIYQKDQLKQIVFPLGGIGAGSIGLAGNGKLVDCEIFNRPNRESVFKYSCFSVKAEDEAGVVDWRVLNGDNNRDFAGTLYQDYGRGVPDPMSGMQHFEDVTFRGAFPFAELEFADRRFPGAVTLEAYNPFIPSNSEDSSLPGAFFAVRVRNDSGRRLNYSVSFNVTNPFEKKGLHTLRKEDGITAITLHSAEEDRGKPQYGNLTVATDHTGPVSYQQNWFRGLHRDMPTMFINDFSAFGPFRNRVYELSDKGYDDTASLCPGCVLEPGEETVFRFVLSWYVPNIYVDWFSGVEPYVLKNYYSTRYKDSGEVADYALQNWARLYDETGRFADALSGSTLPECVADAIQGNLATLKSTTCLRLEDGSFWAWEGVWQTVGSCHGTCQHVWAYAYTLPFLFPDLERGVRSNEFDYSLRRSGMMLFRLHPNLDGEGLEIACVDGQMGAVMQAYRDWKICGDTEWLRDYWPKIKRALEYAWSPENPHRWDPERSGLITGRQHHTLDRELFGPYAWLTGFYHAALLAAAEMAETVGEADKAEEYRDIFRRGHETLETETFNGSYYVHKIDLTDRSVLDAYPDAAETYWSDETGQVKYQIHNGCEIDQVLADWHTDLMGLPHVFDQNHRKSALEAIYANNFRAMRDHSNPWRIFACNEERGVVMCAWPEGEEKPLIPILYTEECMTGFEYAFACNLLQCGMEDKALEVVRAVRDRYDGAKRNPWAELEAGASYARAMASYAFLLTYSGFRYDLSRDMIGFVPLRGGRYFWAVAGAWGSVELDENHVTLEVLYGTRKLGEFVTNLSTISAVAHNGQAVAFTAEGGTVGLTDVVLSAGDTLEVTK
ncbi:MAG: hypothetical protein IJB75_06435 [Oscillospiraceae bacterium]|nr:hypothetical protein [Oscillospiraceae bacterium]